ncbi:MAG: molybdenum cofactor biosynthesis protein MoaE [Candidatus Eisenbacteria bacterium]|uniref:Molybdenum cofactor biosynthesis protein MoaE n=1 Tax=Eiseniibacteriota bacterium TaxID=2212470 RepID=A0A849SWF0_UNCEI|nr:molybdenum cofactor biosynthesis protein MoaE [Candidatus Eisenbacteria bacterium]
MAELVRTVIDTAAMIAAAARPDCGAVVLFLGTTRDHHEGHRVLRLEYEAYESMAQRALSELELDVTARFGVAACGIVHRLGSVAPSEASVAVVVTATHRSPAFEACRWAMDTLKRDIPIWKNEHFEDGESRWAEGTRLHPQRGVSDTEPL